jgi:hypothetical protein
MRAPLESEVKSVYQGQQFFGLNFISRLYGKGPHVVALGTKSASAAVHSPPANLTGSESDVNAPESL